MKTPLRAIRQPCPECPWRKDAPLQKFRKERYEALARTVKSDHHTPMPGDPIFGCHMTKEGREQACAGYLAVEGFHHVSIRIALLEGRVSIEQMQPQEGWPELYASFTEMVQAQGYDAGSLARMDDAGARLPQHDEDEFQLTPETATARWFGPSWGAQICRPDLEVPAPVGEDCLFHEDRYGDAKITEGQAGVSIPHTDGSRTPIHLPCFLRSTVGDMADELLERMEAEGRWHES